MPVRPEILNVLQQRWSELQASEFRGQTAHRGTADGAL